MGSGIDVAIESGDIVLMRGDLRGVADALALSAAVMRNVRQNLFWAFVFQHHRYSHCGRGAHHLRRPRPQPDAGRHRHGPEFGGGGNQRPQIAWVQTGSLRLSGIGVGMAHHAGTFRRLHMAVEHIDGVAIVDDANG